STSTSSRRRSSRTSTRWSMWRTSRCCRCSSTTGCTPATSNATSHRTTGATTPSSVTPDGSRTWVTAADPRSTCGPPGAGAPVDRTASRSSDTAPAGTPERTPTWSGNSCASHVTVAAPTCPRSRRARPSPPVAPGPTRSAPGAAWSRFPRSRPTCAPTSMGARPEVERRRVTLSDVARQGGVSIATAAFVLSGRDGQPAGSPATRSRVQPAAADLGYRPNQHARAIRTGRTGAVALALGDTRDPWMGELAHQVSVRAQTVGLSTVVLADESWFEFLQGHQFDCAFVTGADFTRATREMVAELGRQGRRLVVFSELSPADDFDVISSQMTPAVAKAYGQQRSRHDRVHFKATDTVAVDPPMRTRQELFSDAAVATGDDPGDLVLRVPGTMS